MYVLHQIGFVNSCSSFIVCVSLGEMDVIRTLIYLNTPSGMNIIRALVCFMSCSLMLPWVVRLFYYYTHDVVLFRSCGGI